MVRFRIRTKRCKSPLSTLEENRERGKVSIERRRRCCTMEVQPGVYLGRDMKNASNGPPATSPFNSTAIPPSPRLFRSKVTCESNFDPSLLPRRGRGREEIYLSSFWLTKLEIGFVITNMKRKRRCKIIENNWFEKDGIFW